MLVAKKHKRLILNLRDPERVTTVIPTAKELNWRGHRLVAVNHGIEEVRVLRNLGFDAPAPMGSYYDWPGQYKPFAHQQITAEFLTLNPRAFVLNGMGSGKTLSVLWAYHFLRSLGLIRRMLVISPLSTLERAWGDEIFKHFPDLSFAVLHGTRERRHKLLANDFDIYIINHDGIKSTQTIELLRDREGLDLIVVDELASFRNSQTERWKALNLLINGDKKTGYGRKEWAWGLTGTPTPNGPTDAWAQVRAINPPNAKGYFGAFRDTVMMPQGPFGWKMRDGALEVVKQMMQPAVRFSREECIDLPPTTYVTREAPLTPEQKKAFDTMMRQLKTEHDGGEITAVNEAVKLSKLLQICCLRYDTNVLTHRGWIEIQHVLPTDRVWDGVEWVSHGGAMLMGNKPVIDCGGVRMTEDHLVLSSVGWLTAKEFNDGHASERFDWSPVRLPDGDGAGRYEYGENQKSAVALPLRLRTRRGEGEPVSAQQAQDAASTLWVRARQQDPRHVMYPAVSDMDQHAPALLRPDRQRLGELRGPGNHRLPAVGKLVRSVLERLASRVRANIDLGAHRQQRRLFARELPMGNPTTAVQQQAVEHSDRHPEGQNDSFGGGDSLRSQARNALRSTKPVQVVAGKSTDHPAVYDILDCGPRNRFVVRSEDGSLRVVHNCGLAYGTAGHVELPCQPRLELVNEVVEEAEAKVIVFVPLTGALNMVAEYLRKQGHSVATINGETPKTERDRTFKDFQTATHPRVLVAGAGTMSHGLTLTASNTVVWYAPVHSLETYEQACARVTRPGQKLNTLIVHVESTPLERKIYERLQGRGRTQGLLLEMIKALK